MLSIHLNSLTSKVFGNIAKVIGNIIKVNRYFVKANGIIVEAFGNILEINSIIVNVISIIPGEIGNIWNEFCIFLKAFYVLQMVFNFIGCEPQYNLPGEISALLSSSSCIARQLLTS